MTKPPVEAKAELSLFARKVFGRSLVTGVPNIAETFSRPRQVFKGAVLTICAVGFFYQCTEFVNYILTYPTVVDIEMYTPEEYVSPAYTFCNMNGVKRSKFCAKYPDRCEVPANPRRFCRLNSHYCDEDILPENFTIPKEEYYNFEQNTSIEELKELGHDLEITNPKFVLEGKESGPFIMEKYNSYIQCFSKNLRVESLLDPTMQQKVDFFNSKIFDITLNVEPRETFRPNRRPSALIAVHSPFDLENPFETGIMLRPGYQYFIHLRFEEEDLLPYPYDSNCLDYTERWLKNDRIGPRSQKMCKQKCVLALVLEDCNCTVPIILYPTDAPFCKGEYSTCQIDIWDSLLTKLHLCIDGCKDDCKKLKYYYDVRERFIEAETMNETDADGLSITDKTRVIILVTNPEVFKYSFRAQYQDLEIFSYIGGFMGAWMGVSLVAVIDLVESLWCLGMFLLRRRQAVPSSTA